MKTVYLLFLLLTLLSCSQSNSNALFNYKVTQDKDLAAKYQDQVITRQQLRQGIESDLFELENKIFELKMQNLKSIILSDLIAKQSDLGDLSEEQYIEKKILGEIKVSDKELDEFIKNKKIPQQHVNDELKQRITQFLSQEKKDQVLESWMKKKMGDKEIEVYFRPQRPTFDVPIGDSPVKGAKNAKVTIVEFSDFQCPYCADATENLRKILKEFPNEVRVVFKNFPLPFHPQARDGSNAALCARDQAEDHFWKMHDYMFANQNMLGIEKLNEQAKKLKLNLDDFTQCLEKRRFDSQIEGDLQLGKSLGVRSTPTLFLNGQLLSGVHEFNQLKSIVEEELKRLE